MSAPDLYKQVTIAHADGRHDVVWVPIRLATEGRRLRVLGEEGWCVTAVYQPARSREWLDDQRRGLRYYTENLEPHR